MKKIILTYYDALKGSDIFSIEKDGDYVGWISAPRGCGVYYVRHAGSPWRDVKRYRSLADALAAI